MTPNVQIIEKPTTKKGRNTPDQLRNENISKNIQKPIATAVKTEEESGEKDKESEEEIKISRLSKTTIQKVAKLVDASEYKRRQGPPGVKITPKAFGKDRRLPITAWRRGK